MKLRMTEKNGQLMTRSPWRLGELRLDVGKGQMLRRFLDVQRARAALRVDRTPIVDAIGGVVLC